jgi:hypothetical protein
MVAERVMQEGTQAERRGLFGVPERARQVGEPEASGALEQDIPSGLGGKDPVGGDGRTEPGVEGAMGGVRARGGKDRVQGALAAVRQGTAQEGGPFGAFLEA